MMREQNSGPNRGYDVCEAEHRRASNGTHQRGRNEGSQIIQLFGRGVRFQDFGLNRSNALTGELDHLIELETLMSLAYAPTTWKPSATNTSMKKVW